MSNKTYIVASREFVENMRTKAFWIGIIAVPILILASVIVPIWLDRAKGIRKYVVIDNSGWLMKAVEERAKEPDFDKVLKKLMAPADAKGKKDAQIADLQTRLADATGALKAESEVNHAAVKGLAESLRDNKELQADLLNQLGDFFQALGTPEDQAAGRAALAMLPEKLRTAILTMHRTIIEWWRALPDDDAREYQSRSGRGRYERIEVAGSGDALIEDLNKQIQDKKLFAYFVINADPVKDAKGAKYVSVNLTDDALREWFERYATDIVREKRMRSEEIDAKTSEWLLAGFDFETKKVSEEGVEAEVAKEDTLKQIAPVVFVYLLWIAIFSISQMLLTNTIEEKSNRILEVLLSSISPLELMLGKIFGIAATGLTMVVVWVLSALACVHFVPAMLGAESVRLTEVVGDPLLLASFVAYFLAGYLFFSALFVGIGSVCNSVKEASNLMMPVTMLLMVPLLSMIPIMKEPDGSLAKFLSYVPPFTPFVMMNRAAGPPSTQEYVITSIELLVSIILVMWGAAKIFRVGVLMTGKAPTLKEVITWMKAPVGHVPARAEENAP